MSTDCGRDAMAGGEARLQRASQYAAYHEAQSVCGSSPGLTGVLQAGMRWPGTADAPLSARHSFGKRPAASGTPAGWQAARGR